MKKSLFVFLFIFTFFGTFSQIASAEDCPELNSKLKNILLDYPGYRVAFLETFPQVTQKRILEETHNHCQGLVQPDPDVEAFGVLMQDTKNNHYHVFHAVKCDCKGGPGWRIVEFGEFADDIPIIEAATEEAYFDDQTNQKIEVGTQWKALSVELLNKKDKYLYKRHDLKAEKHKLKTDPLKVFQIAAAPQLSGANLSGH